MKKVTFLFLFIIGFSLTAFTQVSNYEYRESAIDRKKRTFKAPVIRIGVLSDSSFVSPVITKPMPLDTQAIYVVTVELDSAYVVTELDSIKLRTQVDTIQKVGGTLYNVGINENIEEEDDNWEMIQNYLAISETPLDTVNENMTALPDTQVFYVLTEKVDSILVVNNPTSLEQMATIDSMNIDTFYQVGPAIYQNDLESSIEEEDWKVIKEELLRDSLININFEDLTYEEYLDTELSQIQDTAAGETFLVFQPIVLDKESKPSEVDTTMKRDKALLVPDLKKEENNESLERVNLRLLAMERKLDSIQNNQYQQANEKQLILPPAQTAVTPSKEVIELRKKIEQLEAQTQQKSDPELEKMKQQLSLYESQNKEAQSRNKENEKLKAEIELLRKDINASQGRSNTPPVQVLSTQNPEEINQLKTEVASINQNIEIMKQLLLQQQIIESLKKQPQTVVESKDTSNNELLTLRKEIAELKTKVSLTEKPQTTIIASPVDNNKGEIDTLKQQIVSLQKELKTIREQKPVEPKVEKVIVEVPVEKPKGVMELIQGREKQIVFFNIGSSKLSSGGLGQAASIAQLMLQYNQLKVTLEAHTDSSGDATKNLMLSKKRAESVRAALLEYGIAANRISMDYRGEDAQSAPTFGRRVEMILKTE